MNTPEIIKEGIEKLGLSRTEVSKYLGISEMHVYDLESYENEVEDTLDIYQIYKIADLLEIEPEKICKQLAGCHLSEDQAFKNIQQLAANSKLSIEELSEKVGWDLEIIGGIMEDYRYDAYCGLYCGACEIINAESDKEKERVAKMWGSTPGQVNCRGCKTDILFIHCGNCKIRNCARGKGVEFCFECDDYPCSIYEEGKGIIEQLPHIKATIANQKYIKENGTEQWLVSQKTKWKCPQCGTQFAWYTQECKKCHKDLSGLKDYENLTDQDFIV